MSKIEFRDRKKLKLIKPDFQQNPSDLVSKMDKWAIEINKAREQNKLTLIINIVLLTVFIGSIVWLLVLNQQIG